jgi:hypothetical protein
METRIPNTPWWVRIVWSVTGNRRALTIISKAMFVVAFLLLLGNEFEWLSPQFNRLLLISTFIFFMLGFWIESVTAWIKKYGS